MPVSETIGRCPANVPISTPFLLPPPPSHKYGSERLAKEWLRCHGLDASVEWWARRQRCSLRCGGLGVRTQPLLLPRADRPAAALVPSTSHGAARIMIELRNKHTLTGKHAAFRSYFARSSAAISLAKA